MINTNLDDASLIRSLDRGDMLSHIDAFARQLENAWALSQTLPLPATHQMPRQIVIAGMGGSAIGGDLMASLVTPSAPVPVSVVRGYTLPAFAKTPNTLIIASSFSGNTEETLAAADQALVPEVRALAITTGGQLAAHAGQHGYPLWQFDYVSQPRAALGWSFGLLIGLAHRLQLAPHLEADLAEALAVLRDYQPRYSTGTPADSNPAKQGALRLLGKVPLFLGGGMFETVARRWKCQLNENAKVWAQYEGMPEANHNMVVGIEHAPDAIPHMALVFLSSPAFDHPRVQLRHKLTTALMQEYGIAAETFAPAGTSALAQMLHAIQYGDYLSFYLAMAYGADPTEIVPIMALKSQLAAAT